MSFNERYAKEEKKTFSPPEGVQAAARKALKWIEEGHAGSGFTGVGRGRAHQLANGEAVSLSTIKRMHSFFSRHRVDKQGKDWNKPSAGKVAWYAWGGDAGASWAAGIVKKHSVKTSMNWNQRYAHFTEDVHPIPKDIEEYISHIKTHHPGRVTPDFEDSSRSFAERCKSLGVDGAGSLIRSHIKGELEGPYAHPGGAHDGDHVHTHSDDLNVAIPDNIEAITKKDNKLNVGGGNVIESKKIAALMDNVSGGPCTGKSECGTCMDLDEVINDLAETDGSGKLTPKARINIDKIKSIKKLHKDLRGK